MSLIYMLLYSVRRDNREIIYQYHGYYRSKEEHKEL